MRLRLVSCEIFHREMCAVVARSPNQVDVDFLPKGLHDVEAGEMLRRVQTAVDAADPDVYDAVIMGYALCNNGLNGLRARAIPVILPRAHDCISLFLGSRERYRRYFFDNPGVYFKTTGWIERDSVSGELSQLTIQHQTGMDRSYHELVEKYGEDNARFLYEQLYDMTRNYRQLTYIRMGVEPDDRFERHTERQARERGWSFEAVDGDMSMIRRLVDGEWSDHEFLTIPPGGRAVASMDEGIVDLDAGATGGNPS